MIKNCELTCKFWENKKILSCTLDNSKYNIQLNFCLLFHVYHALLFHVFLIDHDHIDYMEHIMERRDHKIKVDSIEVKVGGIELMVGSIKVECTEPRERRSGLMGNWVVGIEFMERRNTTLMECIKSIGPKERKR